MLLSYINTIFNSILQLTLTYSQALEATAMYSASEEYLSDESASPIAIAGRSAEVIEIKGLTYTVQNFLLGPISMSFSPGERIAVIGTSGSGKSTFLQLLAGLKTLTSGTIRAGERDIDPAGEMGFALYVPQTPEIFDDSLKVNIALDQEIEGEALQKSLAIADLLAVVEKLPLGAATLLGANGSQLSGGQKQRVALARASLRLDHFQLLLFDEPTSSLDEKTESVDLKNLFAALTSQVLLFSLHRLSLLKWFTRVIIFNEGKVRYDGPPDELLCSSLIEVDPLSDKAA